MKLLCHQCHFTSQDHLCNVITLHEAQLFHVQSRKLVYVSTVAPSYATVLFLGEVTVLMLLKFFSLQLSIIENCSNSARGQQNEGTQLLNNQLN